MKNVTTYPQHILVIPDGNRRYAKANNWTSPEVYKKSAAKITEIMEWVFGDYDAKQLTIHGLSYENIKKRQTQEIQPILKAITSEFMNWCKNKNIHKEEIKVNILGEHEKLPPSFHKAKKIIEETTKQYGKKELNILIGYSGQREILKTVRDITDDDDENKILERLWLKKPIDLVIRTSNTYRLSNCPLYQINYSEFAFIEKCFPEIEKEDMEKIMEEYQLRERRYGK